MKRFVIAVALLAASAAFASEAYAGWGQRLFSRQGQAPRQPHNEVHRGYYPSHTPDYDPYKRWEWLYPKYTGGLHYRHLYYNNGWPSADDGLRGSPW